MRIWLTEARKKAGLTQKALAEIIGVAPPAVCQYEAGQTSPKISTAQKIAEVLGFEWTRFYEDSPEGVEEE